MKKAGLLFFVLVILGSFLVKDSEAGQWCWETRPGYYLKLSYAKNDANYPFWVLSGMFYGAHYVTPLIGTMVNKPDSRKRVMTLVGSFTIPPIFYLMNAEIDIDTKDGQMTQYGLLPDSDITYFDTLPLTNVDCRTLPAP